MPHARRTALRWILLVSLSWSSACAEPPTKELDQAQGAIETARAAGAETFAPGEFKVAVSALARAHAAVKQRDFRLALSLALDAKEGARDSARVGATRMAELRSEAARTIESAARALEVGEARLTADGPRLTPGQRAAVRKDLDTATSALQEARTALQQPAFPGAKAAAERALAAVRASMETLADAQARPPRRPPARTPRRQR